MASGATDAIPGDPGTDAHRFGVRCSRCGRTQPHDRQPPVSQWPYCVYCASPLDLVRWVALPPPGLGPAPRVRRVTAPYGGPPRYGLVHPEWGFPPIARLRVDDVADPVTARRPAVPAPMLRRRCTAAISLALAATLGALAAAAAESWRFALLLRGRTEVLPASLVGSSDAAVAIASLAAAIVSALALLAGAGAVAACYRAAAERAGLRPARSPGDIMARFLVPGWNLYGAGQIVVEVIRLVFRPVRGIGRPAPRWVRRVVAGCWLAWAGSGVLAAVLVVLAIVPAMPWSVTYGNQTAANLVEAHVLLDVVAAVAALLFAVTLAAVRREWSGGRPGTGRWSVAQPASTARNRQKGPASSATGGGQSSADL